MKKRVIVIIYILLISLSPIAGKAHNPINISPVSKQSSKVIAKLENEMVRISFFSCKRNNQKSVTPVFEVKTSHGWYKAPADPSSESYQILTADTSLEMGLYRLMHPKWKAAKGSQEKDKDGNTQVIWNAGKNHEAIIKKATQEGKDRVVLEFYPLETGTLKVVWELLSGSKTAKVKMHFTPIRTAQYSLGYFLFNSKSIEEVDELLMPMLVARKRFPKNNYTQLQAAAPTPLSLMQITQDGQTLSWGICGEPTQVPYEFPIPIKSHYGLHIKNTNSEVQPSIYGPLLGTKAAHTEAGKTLTFSFRVFVENGDWYSTYRDIADNVFGWYDYRKNGEVSMSQSIYNMIDLYMDDKFGGWWDRAKANYQIESRNGSTQSSPLAIASLYRLTGDTSIYRRRTLPTLEYVLSRDNPHFSPEPENTGGYNRGHMNGPVDIFGATVYAGLWEMMNHRTPVFKDIAFPDGKVKPTTVQQRFIPHVQPFDDWMGKYLYTGDKAALDSAIVGADKYIEEVINKAPEQLPSLREFFLMAYTPDWEGLLALYEVTGKKRFLNAAEQGARVVMTGMWTQPMPKEEMVTIHPNNYVHGDKMDRWLHKGEEEFRLGYPRKKGDVIEKQVPAWLVSNAGLGFEQPSTYTYKDNGGRMIQQANWTGGFLRLAHYTGDKQFETYARNAALARMGNYAGYYYTTFTDLYQNPCYPYEGPDIGFVYYHHIPVHLSWTIDYLVSEAKLASNGKVSFPGLRQFGYAYFDNSVYGHAPGEVFGQKDVWLWFDKNLVDIDNPQINYLTAHTNDKFYLIMMNESQEAQQVNIQFNSRKITKGKEQFDKAIVLTENNAAVFFKNNRGEIEIAPRGFTVIEINNLDIEVATHKKYPTPKEAEAPYCVEVNCKDGTQVRAYSIQMHPGEWHAYVYSTAESKTLKKITLNWSTGSNKGKVIDMDYPYEFSVPVGAGEGIFSFRVEKEKPDGTIIKTKTSTIGVVR
jgi:hypothetical protein